MQLASLTLKLHTLFWFCPLFTDETIFDLTITKLGQAQFLMVLKQSLIVLFFFIFNLYTLYYLPNASQEYLFLRWIYARAFRADV
jgi:hypothetical protein